MKKASLYCAGLMTLLFSPPAFALTPTSDWTTQNPAVVQHVTPQAIPFTSPSEHPVSSQFANENQNSIQNGFVNQPWIDQTPAPEAANRRSDDSEAASASVNGLQSSPYSVPPPPTEDSATSAGALAEHTGRVVEADRPFGATPIQSQLGVEFDLSNSAQPLPAPDFTPVSPAQSVQANPPVQTAPVAQSNPTVGVQPPQTQNSPEFTLKDLFAGDSDSVVAVTVGNAEGTRQPNGQPNKAFYGHTDPGNGVWNLGTFSFQHGADSPEAADVKQLNRLKQQARVMQQKAADHGLKLTLEEALNGIDLANQAPQAVVDAQGYVEWLAKAYAQGLNGTDAILWARVHSFIDPKTQQWNAPGLGNTRERITHDQQRRMGAISNALTEQDYAISPDARLKPQSIVFRIPGWLGMVRQVASDAAQWFGL